MITLLMCCKPLLHQIYTVICVQLPMNIDINLIYNIVTAMVPNSKGKIAKTTCRTIQETACHQIYIRKQASHWARFNEHKNRRHHFQPFMNTESTMAVIIMVKNDKGLVSEDMCWYNDTSKNVEIRERRQMLSDTNYNRTVVFLELSCDSYQ